MGGGDELLDPGGYRSSGTVEVMVFRPTMAEFRDFDAFVERMERRGAHEACGIAKVVPPAEWSARPSRDHFADVDDYLIDSPVVEKMMGRTGCYTKFNVTHRKAMSVREYRQKATSLHYAPPVIGDPDEIERYYWRNILNHQPIYGADSAGSIYDEDVDVWNINRLGTILDLIATDCGVEIKGVNTAYLYFGMWKTTFPWHCEDMDLYSINYLHFGANKFWYGVPSSAAARLERLAATLFPSSMAECGAFLRHKMHMISPAILRKHSIPYGTMVQRAGEFMITFPKGYHAGFNTGYNCAESTNFASDRWIDYGKEAELCTCAEDTVRIDMTPFMKKYRPDEFADWHRFWYESDDPAAVAPATSSCTRSKRQPVAQSDDDAPHRKRGRCAQSTAAREPPRSTPSPDSQVARVRKGLGKWSEPLERLWQCKIPCWDAERQFNADAALDEPHCAVCQYFVPRTLLRRADRVPARSRRLLTDLCFGRDPTAPLGAPSTSADDGDRLLVCAACSVAVHAGCYGVDCSPAASTSAEWLCNRCVSAKREFSECRSCVLRGGALQPTLDGGFVHVICALYNPNARFCGPKRSVQLAAPCSEDGGGLWSCDLCGSDSGWLATCSACSDTHAAQSLLHVTCGRLAGVSYELRDWPLLVAVVCPHHDADGRELEPVEVGERVIGWLEQGTRVRRGRVTARRTDQFCVVDFEDGSLSSDLYLADIVHCSCAERGCRGAHTSGARVKVKWTDEIQYDGVFRRAYEGTTFSVLLDDGAEVECSREEIYSSAEPIPDVVMERLNAAVAE